MTNVVDLFKNKEPKQSKYKNIEGWEDMTLQELAGKVIERNKNNYLFKKFEINKSVTDATESQTLGTLVSLGLDVKKENEMSLEDFNKNKELHLKLACMAIEKQRLIDIIYKLGGNLNDFKTYKFEEVKK